MFGTVGAVLIVSVNDCFGVAVGIKGVAQLLKLVAELAIVVDFAVENNPGGAVLVMNWLRATGEVDDGQPPHPQAYGAVEIEAVVIGSTVTHGVCHARQQRTVNIQSVTTNNSYNSTHTLECRRLGPVFERDKWSAPLL